MRRVVAVCGVLAASLSLAASPVLAQNPEDTADGKSFASTIQPKAVAAATSHDTTVVPKAGEDTATLQSYFDNPTAMRNAGINAAPSSEIFNLSGAATTNASTSSVSDTDAWLARSFDIANNPNAELGTTSGDGAQTCVEGTKEQAVTSTSLYTCESGQSTEETEGFCVAQLRVDIKSVYDYACMVTYDQTSRTWEISTACAALDGAAAAAPPTCTKTGDSCTSPAPPYFQARQCIKGDQWSSDSKTCQENLIVGVDTDYLYACGSTYDQTAKTWVISSQCAALNATSPNCALQSETCTSAATPYFTNRVCRSGTQWGIGTQTREPVRQITVRTLYVYNGERIWNGSVWAPDASQSALQTVGPPTCQIQATTCAAATSVPPTYSCQRGYQAITSSGVCTNAFSEQYPDALKEQGYIYTYSGTFRAWLGATWSVAIQAQAKASMEAMFAGADCVIVAPATRGSRSASPHQQYVQWSSSSEALRCKNPVTMGLPPGPYSVSTSSWASLTSTNYTSGRDWSVNHQLTYGPNPCNALPTTCPKTTLDPSRSNYTCQNQTAYPGCAAPAGMTLQGSSCIATHPTSGACTGFADTYIDPTGGCSRWTDQWLCQVTVPGAGTPVSTPKSIESETWSPACAQAQANPTCTKTADVVTQGPETRTIDGLAIFRDSWALQSTYSCAAGTAVDTCTATTGGCTRTAEACVGHDAGGACSLWDYTYSCPADDGSGNCSAKSATYLCADPVPAAGTPAGTPKTIISDAWDAGCALEASSPNCVAGAVTAIGGSQTRTIDGLAITRDPWTRERAFVCWASSPIDGCTGNTTGCTPSGQTCVSTNKEGACTAWQYSFQCPADDGSGNCSVRTSTYSCTAPVPAAEPAASVTHSVTNMYWSAVSGECKPDFDRNCKTAEETCMVPGPTRMINGVEVTAACFQKHVRFYCEAKGPVTTNCAPAAGCVLEESACLDDGVAGPCSATEHRYSCTSTAVSTVKTSSCSATMCLDGSCFTLDPSEDHSSDLGQAYAALSVAKVGGGDYASAADLKVMSGKAQRCRKSVLGFKNCCKDSGWGVDMGLAQCDESEKTLIEQQKGKACHYVGTSCSHKTFFGTCLTKSMQYCCFDSALGRIVNEAGRPQIGKSWGSPKSPNCSGFTVEEFQKLDLSTVDFTDFYAETMAKLNPPGSTSTTTAIGDTLTALYGSGSPNNLPAEVPC